MNVWTPASADGSLPVLFWIHGGAYTFGSSAQPEFDGTTLARAGLVVVTCNYRLGFEGFGHIPAGEGSPFTDGSPYPDNRGLLDQIAALRWVRENIAAFGGDPDDVTAAGQSSVACLMVMDRARGLFHRAVAHSVASPWHSIEVAEATTLKVAAMAGSRATPESLSSTSPQVLVAASDRVVDEYRDDPGSGARHYDPVIYAPVVDGDVLPTDPLSGVAAGAARGVDLLVCHTTEESWLFDAVGSSARVSTDEQLAMFATDFGLPDDLMAGYRAGMPNAAVLDIYLAIFGDLMFGELSCRLAERQAQSGGRAFMSRFARHRDDSGHVVRAWHCADIPFASGNLDNDGAAFLIGGTSNAADRDLSRRMVRAWADFAATGDPGWPPIMGSTTPVRTWNTDDTAATATAAAATDELMESRALWRNVDLPFLPR